MNILTAIFKGALGTLAIIWGGIIGLFFFCIAAVFFYFAWVIATS